MSCLNKPVTAPGAAARPSATHPAAAGPIAGLLAALLFLHACAPSPSVPQQDRLQAEIQRIGGQYAEAEIGVAVYDFASDAWFESNAGASFHAASTMKIPVMIEVYRQAAEGRFSLSDSIAVNTTFHSLLDGSPFTMTVEDDADDALYHQIGGSMAIGDLVYAMITVSSNLATNLLIEYVGAENVQQTVDRLGAGDVRVLRGVQDIKAYEADLNNTATARDLAVLLKAMAEGNAVSPDADEAMIEVMLRQEFTELIPAGIPAAAAVANKTGSITRIRHDAAIVYPAGGEPYVLVVLTGGIEESERSAALIRSIARTVHDTLRPQEEDVGEHDGVPGAEKI